VILHIYVFGSLCRGEVSRNSDVDLLALVDGFDSRFNPDSYSIYSYGRIKELWMEGNPFAWHLSKESCMIFSSDETDFIKELGKPSTYENCIRDCEKFRSVFLRGREQVIGGSASTIFELSTIFLSMRNIATCYSLGVLNVPCFSRDAALRLGSESAPIPLSAFQIFERSRILCTRGEGIALDSSEIAQVIPILDDLDVWMATLVAKARSNERIQLQN